MHQLVVKRFQHLLASVSTVIDENICEEGCVEWIDGDSGGDECRSYGLMAKRET